MKAQHVEYGFERNLPAMQHACTNDKAGGAEALVCVASAADDEACFQMTTLHAPGT